MKYTWLGKEAEILIEEQDRCEYNVSVKVSGQVIKVAEMSKRSNGNFAAMADGYLYNGETAEEVARKAVDVKHEQAEARSIATERVNESAVARKKWKKEEKERQEAFE